MTREELRLKCLELSVNYIKQRRLNHGDATEECKITNIAREFESYITEPYQYNYYGSECNNIPDEEDNLGSPEGDLPAKDTGKKTRRMTNQELSWWLHDKPEEHREWRFDSCSNVYSEMNYSEEKEHNPVPENIVIRSNGGEWMEPMI